MKLFFLLAAGLATNTFAGTISIPNNSGSVYFAENPTNSSATRTLGQTFMVPAPTGDNILTDFTFYFADGTDTTFDYCAMIFAWDAANTRATGPALFTSGSRNGLQAPSFSGLNLVLTAGVTYVALLTTQGVGNDGFANGLAQHNSINVYTGGAAYSQISTQPNGSTGSGDWTTAAWSATNGDTDFQFDANFVAVPEPGTWALLGAGLAGLALLRRRSQ